MAMSSPCSGSSTGAVRFDQRQRAAGDRLRRVEPVHRPGCKAPEDIGEKGIMRAGKDDDIGAVAVLLIEARRNFCAYGFVIDVVAANMRFGHGSQILAADKAHMALRGERTG